jgi:hypothetical protein
VTPRIERIAIHGRHCEHSEVIQPSVRWHWIATLRSQ